MKRLTTCLVSLALVVAVGCGSDSAGNEGDCEGATAVYQDRIDFVFDDNLDLRAEYKAMTKAEQDEYDAGTADALDAMNRACGTGPYA